MSHILINKEHPNIHILTLNRPEKRNALSIALMEEFQGIIQEENRNPELRVIIINGNGPVFCAGLDLSEIADPEKSHRSSELVATTLTALYESPKVTIAAVQGAAIGGGAGLMAACDFVLATPETLFGYPETRRGLVAAQVMPFLARQLKQRDIRELLLFGELINPEKALSIGLINRIVPMEKMADECMKYAALVLKGAPDATTQSKKLIEELWPSNFPNDLKQGLAVHRAFRDSPEAKEGAKAFMENRKPYWEKIP